MKVVGLLSGGKDSCYNLCHAAKQGHEIVALATLAPPSGKDELDSYMYQTVGHDAVHLVAEAMGLPLYRHIIKGQSLRTGTDFTVSDFQDQDSQQASTSNSAAFDETRDLFELLQLVKQHHPDVQGVSVGAILSNYQRFRVEAVCMHPALQLQPLAYLWQRTDQAALLDEMIAAGVNAVLIKVAGAGLEGDRHLGKSLAQMRGHLRKLEAQYGAHVCGEGGEYETLTLDCPLFKQRIRLEDTEMVVHSETGFASVAYLRIKKAVLEDKDAEGAPGLGDVKVPPMLDALGRKTLRAAQRGVRVAKQQQCTSSGTPTQKPSGPRSPSQPLTKRHGPWLSFSLPPLPASQAFRTLADTLASKGVPMAGTVQHVNLCLESQSHFLAVNKIYKETFAALEPPSRATVALPSSNAATASTPGADDPIVSLDGVAYHPGDQQNGGAAPSARQALHVQSLSYWSAANIGPYSQAVSVASRISVAGQIGLRPLDLTLPTGLDGEEGQAQQVALSLQHARRILAALGEERCRAVGKGWVEGGVVWLSGADAAASEGLLDAAREAWGAQELNEDEDDDDGEDDDDDASSLPTSSWILGDEGIRLASSASSSASRPAQPHDLPLLYATLRPGDLPRGAAVEWQLTAHDGRHVAPPPSTGNGDGDNDDDDDDDAGDGEAQRPTVMVNELHGLPLASDGGASRVSIQTRSISSRDGASHFGVVAVRVDDDAQAAGADASQLDAVLDELRERLQAPGTLSAKVFVDAASGAAGQFLLDELNLGGDAGVPASLVSTLGLWTTGKDGGAAQRWQAALVWHAVA